MRRDARQPDAVATAQRAAVLANASSSLPAAFRLAKGLGAFVAHQLQTRDPVDQVKIRSPRAADLLPFLTFGMYASTRRSMNRELRDHGCVALILTALLTSAGER